MTSPRKIPRATPGDASFVNAETNLNIGLRRSLLPSSNSFPAREQENVEAEASYNQAIRNRPVLTIHPTLFQTEQSDDTVDEKLASKKSSRDTISIIDEVIGLLDIEELDL